MTRAQYVGALLVLFIGGVVGGIAFRAHPAGAADDDAAGSRQPTLRVKPTLTAVPDGGHYFTSSITMGVMTEDKGFQHLPSLVVWRYGASLGKPGLQRTSSAPAIHQVRLARAPQDVVQGTPSEWEYVPLPMDDGEDALLFRYRIYEPTGQEPLAEYEYLGRCHPSFSGVGAKPGTPE